MEISIRHIWTDDGQWGWTLYRPDAEYHPHLIGWRADTVLMRTNEDGEGVWQKLPSGSTDADGWPVLEWKQTIGTTQFSLQGKSLDEAEIQIRREFEVNVPK